MAIDSMEMAMHPHPLSRAIAIGLSLVLAASCVTSPTPQRTAPAEAKLEAACKANYPVHAWKRSEPPEDAVRRLYSIPKGATAQLWFRGGDKAIAVCTPCAAGSASVKSFEWYSPGFKQGELGLKNCPAAK
jgi:hypothetical protein